MAMLYTLTKRWLALVAITIIVSVSLLARPAQAGAPYQGIYVVVDPYDQGTIASLQTASVTSCAQNQQQVVTPFCGAANGLLIRIPWCDFQLYHVNNSSGQPYPSCHYALGFTLSGTGPWGQMPSTDEVSPCNGSYDICTGASRSLLGSTLHLVALINGQRAIAGLPPLNLSIGIYAGDGTPQGVLDAVGWVDVPFSSSAAGVASANQCVRLPLDWKAPFLTAYEQASDQLLAYVKSQFPAGANITLVKPAGIVASDLEIDVPGKATAIPLSGDPGPPGPGLALACPAGNAAQVWLNAYNQNPNAGQNFSQAQESAFGAVIGHYWGTLANLGLANVALSIPTTNGQVFPAIDCGSQGNLACSVKGSSSGNWSVYYFEKYVDDLFNGGLAYTQAVAAYQAIRGDTFSLAPSQLSVNPTALALTPVPSLQQVSCNLNNTVAAHAPVIRLDSVNVTVPGVGTMLAAQTTPLQAPECQAGTYGQVLQSGIANGSLFLEVQTDVAFGSIAYCSAPLSSALTQVLAASPPTTCAY